MRAVLDQHDGDHVAAAADGVRAEHVALDFQQLVREFYKRGILAQHPDDAWQVGVVFVKAVELAQQVHADWVPLGVQDVVDLAGQLVFEHAAGARLADPVVLPVCLIVAFERGFLLRVEDISLCGVFNGGGVDVAVLWRGRIPFLRRFLLLLRLAGLWRRCAPGRQGGL